MHRTPTVGRVVRLLTLLLILSFAATGCDIFPSAGTGTLEIRIDEAVSRTMLPEIPMIPASYVVSGTGPGDATFSTSTETNEATIEGLAFGEWTVTVTALNANETEIGEGESQATVRTNATTTVDVTVRPFEGDGPLTVTVTWNQGDVDIPSVEGELLPPSGGAREMSFTVNGNTASATLQDAASGYHTLTVQLFDNGAQVIGAVEVVRIVAGQPTQGDFVFDAINKPGGSVQVNISAEMRDPLDVDLGGGESEKAGDAVLPLDASVAGYTGNVSYVWYVNGESQGTGETFTFGDSWDLGFYRIDVTAYSADGLRAGSDSIFVEVVEGSGASTPSVLTGPAPGTFGGQRAFDSQGNVYVFTYQGGLYKIPPGGSPELIVEKYDVPGYPHGFGGSPLVLDDDTLLMYDGNEGILQVDLTTYEVSTYASFDMGYGYAMGTVLLDASGAAVSTSKAALIGTDGTIVDLGFRMGSYAVYSGTSIYSHSSDRITETDLNGENTVYYPTNSGSLYGTAMGPDGSVYVGMGAGSPDGAAKKIHKLDPATGDVSHFATSPNWVNSLVYDGDRYLYAGGFSDGGWNEPDMEDIYRIDLETGSVTLVD